MAHNEGGIMWNKTRVYNPGTTDEEVNTRWPDHVKLNNRLYNRLVTDYTRCLTVFTNDFYAAEITEKQLERRDLDTVCAYELYQMKKVFNNTDCLSLKNYVHEIRGTQKPTYQ